MNRCFRTKKLAKTKTTVNAVKGMIEKLPIAGIAVALAFYHDKMKIKDIAAVFECPIQTVRKYLKYTKKFLGTVECEKRKHHSIVAVSSRIIAEALKILLDAPKYKMSPALATSTYSAICGTLGLEPTGLKPP